MTLSAGGDIQDAIRESLELSQVAVANPFKQQTFGTKVGKQLLAEEESLRQSTKSLAYEAELAEKTREELQATHQANMDELDEINKRLLATLNKKEEDEEDDFDVEREEPLEEQKFKQINNTEMHELTTEKQMSFAREDGLPMNEPEPINQDLMTTMKTDVQRATMTKEMKTLKPQGTAVFNPFSSKAEEEEGQFDCTSRSEGESISRD